MGEERTARTDQREVNSARTCRDITGRKDMLGLGSAGDKPTTLYFTTNLLVTFSVNKQQTTTNNKHNKSPPETKQLDQ